MCLDILVPLICGLICMCSGTAVRTQAFAKDGLPAAEISSLRLTTGDQLVLKCYWTEGLPVWKFSSSPRNPEFVELPKNIWDVSSSDCGRSCFGRILKATFSPSLAGVYRCTSAEKETFTIMWVNESVLVDQPIVKANGYGKPVSVPCKVNLLPAEVEYQRQIKWFVSNDNFLMQDVTQCCSGIYSVETTSSPGPSSLIVHNYDASRDYGIFRCSVKIDGYGKELYSDTKIYAELDIRFDITTGNRNTPVLAGYVVEVLHGELLNITCIARGNPSPLSIRMYQNGIIKSSETVASRGVLRSSITISNVTDGFNDTFSCDARQDLGNTPLSSPSSASQTVFFRVVSRLSPPVSETEDGSAFLSVTATIAVYITIPLVTIIIVVIVVYCWRVRKNRRRNQERSISHEFSASNGAKPPQRSLRVSSECQQPLRSLVPDDSRL